VHTTGQLTNTRRSDGAPELDGALREVARTKILHYRQLYINRPDPISFLPVEADVTGRVYDDFSRLLFLHAHREASALAIPYLLTCHPVLLSLCHALFVGDVLFLF
jgi:hypothetical protein